MTIEKRMTFLQEAPDMKMPGNVEFDESLARCFGDSCRRSNEGIRRTPQTQFRNGRNGKG